MEVFVIMIICEYAVREVQRPGVFHLAELGALIVSGTHCYLEGVRWTFSRPGQKRHPLKKGDMKIPRYQSKRLSTHRAGDHWTIIIKSRAKLAKIQSTSFS